MAEMKIAKNIIKKLFNEQNQHKTITTYQNQFIILLFIIPFILIVFEMFAAYNRLLTKYPLLTKMITSGTLFSLGDIITQTVVDKKSQVDWARNRNLFIVGSLYFAPMLHMWYCKLLPSLQARFFNDATAKTTRVFTSMAVDQLLFAPIILAGFFVTNSLFEDPSADGFKKGIRMYKEKIWETLKINWMIWPIATTVNFWWMPVQYQVLFANCVGLFWNIILSYIAYDEKPGETIASHVV